MRRQPIQVALVLLLSASVFAESRVELEGYAEWRDEDVLVVEGQRVRLGPGARVEGPAFHRIPLGYEVEVDGVRAPDGTVVARSVESKPNGSAMFEGQLERAFDETERHWLRLGRVVSTSSDGRTMSLGRLRTSGRDVERVRRVARRLIPPYGDPNDFRVYVVENDEWNAMAAPNGSIYVFKGLLRDMDDDELAVILGHELVHATHEHSRRQQKRSLWTNLSLAGGLAVLGGLAPDGGRRQLVETAVGLSALAFQNRYSRGHEDQADRVGLRYAHEAGYDVSKAPELWRRFARKYGSEPAALNFFFGGHSTPAARVRNLEREIQVNYR